MNKDRFQECLSLYGSEIDNWPEDLKTEAHTTLASSPELKALLDQEREFENALGQRAFEPPSPNLATRIVNTAKVTPRTAKSSASIIDSIKGSFGGIPFLSPAYGLTLVLIVGLMLGYAYTSYTTDEEPESIEIAGLLYYDEGYYE